MFSTPYRPQLRAQAGNVQFRYGVIHGCGMTCGLADYHFRLVTSGWGRAPNHPSTDLRIISGADCIPLAEAACWSCRIACLCRRMQHRIVWNAHLRVQTRRACRKDSRRLRRAGESPKSTLSQALVPESGAERSRLTIRARSSRIALACAR